MNNREAMKLALEALEGIHVGNMTPMAEENWNKALTALRQALAQGEQDCESTSIETISNAIDYLYSTGGEAKNIANQAHTALKQLQVNLRDQTALHLLYKGDYEDLLAQPVQEPILTEKDGSPCPEFWDWLPKAYNFEGLGEFTKYNMEVAFLAGKNTLLAQPEQEQSKPQQRNSIMDNQEAIEVTKIYWDGDRLMAVPAARPSKREWVSLTDEQIRDALENEFIGETGNRNLQDDIRVARAALAKYKEGDQ